MRTRDEILASQQLLDWPHQIVFEPTAACNQRCNHCAHKFLSEYRPHSRMAPELAFKIVDEIAGEDPHTEVWPTFYGEALILMRGNRPWLYDILRRAEDQGLDNVVLNTNATLMNTLVAERLCDSGLDKLIISMDAASPEAYWRVRNSHEYQIVVDNVRNFLDVRARLGHGPCLEMQFSEMDENTNDVEKFIKMWSGVADELKVRRKLSWSGRIDGADHDPDLVRQPCPWGLRTCAIHNDGNLVACAIDWRPGFVAGNVREKTIKEIWNGPHLERLRRVHFERRWGDLPEICKGCGDWQVVGATAVEAAVEKAKPLFQIGTRGRAAADDHARVLPA